MAEGTGGAARRGGWLLAVHYGRRALEVVLSALLLFLGVHLFFILLGDLRLPWAAPEGARLILDELPAEVSSEQLEVKGTSEPFQPVQIKVNERIEAVAYTDSRGRFGAHVALKPQANWIVAQPYGRRDLPRGERFSQIARVKYVRLPLGAPEVRSVVDLPGGRKLLIGVADPEVSLAVRPAGSERVAAWGGSDACGIFEVEVEGAVYGQPAGFVLAASHVGLGGETRSAVVPLPQALGRATSETLSRHIRLRLAAGRAHLEMSLLVSARYPYVEKLLAGDTDDGYFMGKVFGFVGVGPALAPLERTISAVADGRLQITYAGPLEDRAVSRAVISPAAHSTERDTLVLAWEGNGPRWYDPFPTLLEARQALWQGPLAAEISFGRELPREEPPATPLVVSEEQQRITWSQALGNVRIPALGTILGYAALNLAVFAWLLWLLRTQPGFLAPAGGGSLERVRAASVWLMLALMSLWYPVYALCETRLFRGGLSLPTGQRPSDLPFWALWLATLLTLAPAARALERRAGDWLSQPLWAAKPASRRRVLLILLLALAVAGAAWWALRLAAPAAAALATGADSYLLLRFQKYLASLPGLWAPTLGAVLVLLIPAVGVRLTLSAAGLAACMLLTGFWRVAARAPAEALREFGLGPQAVLVVQAGLLALVLLCWLPPSRRLWPESLLGRGPRWWFRLWLLAVVPALLWAPERWKVWGAAMVAATVAVWLALRLARAFGLPARWTAAGKIYVAVALLMLAIFFDPGPSKVPALTEALFTLLYDLERLAEFVPLLAILAWLYQSTRGEGAAPAELESLLGAGVFAFYLVGTGAHLFYVPVPFIVGFLLARYWLLREPLAVPGGAPAGGPREWIGELIAWRWAQRISSAARKAQDKKLTKGELKPADHSQAMKDLEAETAPKMQLADRGGGLTARELALAFGPHPSAWDNAVGALRYALPLTMFPLGLAVYQFAQRSAQAGFPVPQFAAHLAIAACHWLLVAFFFGFFFRRLRGSSGLGKAVYLAIALVTPFLCQRLLEARSFAELRPFLLWASQVVAICLVLGLLAFDFETLRRHGYGWQHLTAVHNTPALSAFGSTLAAAALPAAVAIFQGQIADWLKSIAKAILPGGPPPGAP